MKKGVVRTWGHCTIDTIKLNSLRKNWSFETVFSERFEMNAVGGNE